MNANDKIGPPPSVARHERLDGWLDEISAELVWSRDLDMTGESTIECYQVGPETMMVRRSKTGFDVFTALSTNDITASFVDAELRLDLARLRQLRAETAALVEGST